jgi:hypothetical protein
LPGNRINPQTLIFVNKLYYFFHLFLAEISDLDSVIPLYFKKKTDWKHDKRIN